MSGPDLSKQATTSTAGTAESLSTERPWEDTTLSDKDRYESYLNVARAHVKQIQEATQRENLTPSEMEEMMSNTDNRFWMSELGQLNKETAQQFCYRIDGSPLEALLGRNCLGAKEWRKGFGVGVGRVPPIPSSITEELLNSDCPLHRWQKIKDTHVLVLVPKTVNGQAYSALKLDELCATRKGSGDRLIDRRYSSWKSLDWAKAAQAQSEWVLLPKSDPGQHEVRFFEEHFRSKKIAAQQRVLEDHYSEYREAKVLEVMTMALLYDLTHKKQLLPDNLRCEEPNARGGRVCVGLSDAAGLKVREGFDDYDSHWIGRALARKI